MILFIYNKWYNSYNTSIIIIIYIIDNNSKHDDNDNNRINKHARQYSILQHGIL